MELYGITRAELVQLLADWGFHASHAKRLWSYLYRDRVQTIEAMIDLPSRLRKRLVSDARLTQLDLSQSADSSDQLTRKFLLSLSDQKQIETVEMHFNGRMTACVSSQVGCALGCTFCATGHLGFTRNLSAAEIVAQAIFIAQHSDEPLRNIVFMGMGEPLLNFDQVFKAASILSDNAGFAIAEKRIGISTVGVVPGILRWAREAWPYSLAVSLHAANQEDRRRLVPSAETWPLDELMSACRFFSQTLSRKIFFEWTLIEGANDSVAHAEQLADLLRDQVAHVNLIPLNPISNFPGEASTTSVVHAFQTTLAKHGIPSTVRQRRGIDIAAGCGQLALMTT